MKRELKFKAQKNDNNEPVFFDLKTFLENDDGKIPDAMQYRLKNIRQFTGLKDKKSVEIYEGDIVRWDDMSNGEKWRVAVVELHPSLQFRIIRINCDFIQSAQEGKVFEFGKFIYTDTHNHLEIIGNIVDNPEMLLFSQAIT